MKAPTKDNLEQIIFDLIVYHCEDCHEVKIEHGACKTCFVKWCDERFNELAKGNIGSPHKHYQNRVMFQENVAMIEAE